MRSTLAVRAAAIALLALLLATTGCLAGAGAGGAANVPSLPVQDIRGKTLVLSDIIGTGQKVVVMSFWATWCQPCRQELTVLEQLYRKHKDEGLDVLAISGDGPETQAGVRSYAEQQGWSFTVLLDSDTRLTTLYNPRKQMPMLHIFDRSGRQVYTHSTFQPGEAAALRAKVLEVLRAE